MANRVNTKVFRIGKTMKWNFSAPSVNVCALTRIHLVVLKTVEAAFLSNNMKMFKMYVAIESQFLKVMCIVYKREASYISLRTAPRAGLRNTGPVPALPFTALIGRDGGKEIFFKGLSRCVNVRTTMEDYKMMRPREVAAGYNESAAFIGNFYHNNIARRKKFDMFFPFFSGKSELAAFDVLFTAHCGRFEANSKRHARFSCAMSNNLGYKKFSQIIPGLRYKRRRFRVKRLITLPRHSTILCPSSVHTLLAYFKVLMCVQISKRIAHNQPKNLFLQEVLLSVQKIIWVTERSSGLSANLSLFLQFFAYLRSRSVFQYKKRSTKRAVIAREFSYSMAKSYVWLLRSNFLLNRALESCLVNVKKENRRGAGLFKFDLTDFLLRHLSSEKDLVSGDFSKKHILLVRRDCFLELRRLFVLKIMMVGLWHYTFAKKSNLREKSKVTVKFLARVRSKKKSLFFAAAVLSAFFKASLKRKFERLSPTPAEVRSNKLSAPAFRSFFVFLNEAGLNTSVEAIREYALEKRPLSLFELIAAKGLLRTQLAVRESYKVAKLDLLSRGPELLTTRLIRALRKTRSRARLIFGGQKVRGIRGRTSTKYDRDDVQVVLSRDFHSLTGWKNEDSEDEEESTKEEEEEESDDDYDDDECVLAQAVHRAGLGSSARGAYVAGLLASNLGRSVGLDEELLASIYSLNEEADKFSREGLTRAGSTPNELFSWAGNAICAFADVIDAAIEGTEGGKPWGLKEIKTFLDLLNSEGKNAFIDGLEESPVGVKDFLLDVVMDDGPAGGGDFLEYHFDDEVDVNAFERPYRAALEVLTDVLFNYGWAKFAGRNRSILHSLGSVWDKVPAYLKANAFKESGLSGRCGIYISDALINGSLGNLILIKEELLLEPTINTDSENMLFDSIDRKAFFYNKQPQPVSRTDIRQFKGAYAAEKRVLSDLRVSLEEVYGVSVVFDYVSVRDIFKSNFGLSQMAEEFIRTMPYKFTNRTLIVSWLKPFFVLLYTSLVVKSTEALVNFICDILRTNKNWSAPISNMLQALAKIEMREFGVFGIRLSFYGRFRGRPRAKRYTYVWGFNPCIRNSALKCAYTEKQCVSPYGITHVHMWFAHT